MLIRIRGGTEGIAEYLINGKKSGREQSRDELDERLILSGDLSVTDTLIANIDAAGESYKHITLAFKEDYVSVETLMAVTEEIKRFTFAAYIPEEYNFYAEAHLPKIKSYEHSKTGDLIIRKPHIHIVIPKINLITGKQMDPFGYFDLSEKYCRALQQHINDKFGLADPQDNRRIDFTDASEVVSRYKGDSFDGANKEFRAELLNAVLDRGIVGADSFYSLLQEFGTVKVRRLGESNSYANVTRPGSIKGINLKDYVFSDAFLSLAPDEKRSFLAGVDKSETRYEVAAEPRNTPAESIALLKDWYELRSPESKHINSGNKKFYAKYKAMNRDEKIALLAERAERLYTKHLGANHDRSTTERTDARAAAFERIRDNLRSSGANLAAARGLAGNLDQASRNIADRSALRAIAAALAGREGNQGQGNAHRSGSATDRSADASSVAGRYSRALIESRAVKTASKQSEFAEIKQQLQASRLLSQLSKTHGVIVAKYHVTRGKDGSERIQCGTQNLNVSDFLTKHLNLPWKDAAPILQQAYAAQRQQIQHRDKTAPQRDLYAKYQEWKTAALPTLRTDDKSRINSEHKAAIVKAASDFIRERSRIEGDRTITKGEAKRLIDIAKAQREHAKKTARDNRDASRQAAQEKWSAKGDNLYKRFLAEAAQSDAPHAEAALDELRKRAPDLATQEDAINYIRTADAKAAEQGAPIKRDLTYRVDIRGHVTYKIDGRDALKDEGQRVNILQANDAGVIEQGLTLARAKFGNTITLNGTEEFKAQAVRVAVEKNISVDFTDPALQRMKIELQQNKQRTKDLKAQGNRAIEVERERIKKEKEDAIIEKQQQAKAKAKAPAKPAASPVKPAPPAVTEPVHAAPVVPATPATAPELVVTVPGSQPPQKKFVTYKGEIIKVDNSFVYQQTEKQVIHHRRDEFKVLPKEGDDLRIVYNDGKISSSKENNRGQDRGR